MDMPEMQTREFNAYVKMREMWNRETKIKLREK